MVKNSGEQSRHRFSAKALDPDANDGRVPRMRDGNQRVKVGVKRDHGTALRTCERDNLSISRGGHRQRAYVLGIMACDLQHLGNWMPETLVKEDFHAVAAM